MPNEIYHRSEWGNPKAEGFGDVYFDAAATNKLYNHSDYYENSDGTDKILRDLSNKASIVLTPTAYSDGSLNTVIPPYQVLPTELVTNGDFSNGLNNWTNATSDTLEVTDGGTGHSTSLHIVVSAINRGAYQSVFVANTSYFVSLDLKVISGSVYIGKNTRKLNNKNYDNSEWQTISGYLSAIDDKIRIYGDEASEFYIDNVSVKEIQEADFDFSRGSSATRVNEKGLIEDVASGIPRIDYTSGTGALLLEPQSTNKVTQSETFSTWSNISVLLTSTNIVAPDGGTSVIKMSSSNVSSGEHKVKFYPGTNPSTSSIFAKMGEVRYIMNRRHVPATSWQSVVFDLQEGVVAANNYSSGAYPKITHYGNGWYRCEVYYPNLGSTETGWGLSNGTDENFTPTNTTDGLYIWGAQQEDLSFATSYIPTEGSTVTRSADVANNSGNADLINSTEGVLYCEAATLVDPTSVMIIGLSDGTTANRISITFHSTLNRIQIFAQKNSVQLFNIDNTSVSKTNFNKIAISYSSTSAKFFLNGTLVASATPSDMFVSNTLDRVNFDIGSGSNDFYGNVKSLAVFKEALTDAELAQITSATQQEVFYEMRDRMLQINADYYEFDDYTTRLKKLF